MKRKVGHRASSNKDGKRFWNNFATETDRTTSKKRKKKKGFFFWDQTRIRGKTEVPVPNEGIGGGKKVTFKQKVGQGGEGEALGGKPPKHRVF